MGELKMRKIGDKRRPAELKGRWLLTFNDMMTLLLAFFVLIVSMSHLETAKLTRVAAAMRKVFSPASSSPVAKRAVVRKFLPSLRDGDIERERLKVRSREITAGAEERKKALYHYFLNWGGVLVYPGKDGFSLLLGEQLLFVPGAADISPKGQQLLKSLAAALPKKNVEIGVEGYTDDLPMKRGKYPSNWEFSMARAVNVVKYMIDEGAVAPEILSAVGYGDTKARWPNSAASSRQLNRRIEVKIIFKERAR